MKYILIILISLVSLVSYGQDILSEEREPIIVETKADLQTELELFPINYLREEKPDSLQKFNYAYHGRPLNGDFVLFPEVKLTNYLNLSGGSHNLFEITDYLAIKDYTMNLNYLYRADKGDRNAHIFSLENKYSLNRHRLALSTEYLDCYKETPTRETSNETQNLTLAYDFDASELKFFNKLGVKAQYESNSTTLLSEKEEYWNVFSELELEPVEYLFANFKFANNHKSANTQIQIYFKNISAFGLWSGISEEKAILAPFLDLYLNKDNITVKITNHPYMEHKSYFRRYQDHLYGNYYQEETDFMLPANANLELSYFNFLTWSIGSHYKYSLDTTIYRLGGIGEGIYYDSFWETSHYAKASYFSKSLNTSCKVEFIDYNNFDAEFLPFKPEFRITNSISYKFTKLSLNADYIIETSAKDDYNNKLDDSHILNASTNYQLKKWCSLWTEFTNLLNSNSNSYFQDQINQREFKAGIKLFF